jgi:hypothetical protein
VTGGDNSTFLLFNDAVGSSESISLTSRMISKSWIGKDLEVSGIGLIWGNIQEFAWGAQVKLRKPQNSRDSNLTSPEYK